MFIIKWENILSCYVTRCKHGCCCFTLNKFPVCSLSRKQMLQETGKKRSITGIEQMTSPSFPPPASRAVSSPTCPVPSSLAGGVREEHNVVKQKSDLLHSPLALAPSLSPLEITLNDICYHQDNLCQLRDVTADAGPQVVRGWRRDNGDKRVTASLAVVILALELVKSFAGYN